ENRGQWATPARFVAWDGPVSAELAGNGIQFHLAGDRPASVGLTFEGASSGANLVGEGKQGGDYNFFLGNDPGKWVSHAAAYDSVLFHGLYSGVDVRVREGAGQMEYDLLLQPGADLGKVVVRADGASGLALADDGSLIVQTAAGPLRQTAPVTWEVSPT